MSISAASTSAPTSVVVNRSASATGQTQAKGSQSATAASTLNAALKEATETAAQTAKEAGSGDRQAQRLLQKQSHHAVSAAVSTPTTVNGVGQSVGGIINTKA